MIRASRPLPERHADLVALLAVLLLAACATTTRQAPATPADTRLAAQVNAALEQEPNYYFKHVSVHAQDGVVHLSGYVWEPEALNRAKEVASHVPGVTSVVDEMQLERNGRTNGAPAR